MADTTELQILTQAKEGYESSIKHLTEVSARDGVDRSKAIAEEKAIVAKLTERIAALGKPKPV